MLSKSVESAKQCASGHCYRVLLSKHGIIWHYYTHRHPPLKTWESAYYGTSFSSTNKHCSFWSVCICWRIDCKWKQGISCKDGYVTPVVGVGSWNQNQKPKWVYQLLFGYTLGWLVTSATIQGSLTPCWKLVKMAICGPKLSLIGVVLSAWGIIQLVGGTSLPFCSNWFIRSGC